MAGRRKTKQGAVEAEHGIRGTPPLTTKVGRRSLTAAPKAGGDHRDPRRKRAPVQAEKAAGTKHQHSTAAPPTPPEHGQEHTRSDEDGIEGPKSSPVAFTSATKVTIRARNTGSPPASPKRAPPRRGSSSRTIIPGRRRRHHLANATKNHYPTMHTPKARIRGPPTLRRPQRRPEREGTGRSAVGGARNWRELPFRLSRDCSMGRGKGGAPACGKLPHIPF